MPVDKQKRCPRCGNAFECKADSVLDCQCQRVPLGSEQLENIAGLYHGCLCADCLRFLGKEYNESGHAQ